MKLDFIYTNNFIFFNLYLIKLLCFFLILNSAMVLISKNIINSICFLILTFIIATNLLIINNIEYIGLLFIIIYIGAIAILFLFVIMLLNLNNIVIKNNNIILDSYIYIFFSNLD